MPASRTKPGVDGPIMVLPWAPLESILKTQSHAEVVAQAIKNAAAAAVAPLNNDIEKAANDDVQPRNNP
ncbi:hypothetical protein E8E11_001712 [Didymella keratinophila]|nr:hypothetical protein E8E11_001712 [Didymella keratinophila]